VRSWIEDSSAAILQPLLHLDDVESDILSELEMGDRVGCVLPISVVDKRDRDWGWPRNLSPETRTRNLEI